jgi:hypothetical protein
MDDIMTTGQKWAAAEAAGDAAALADLVTDDFRVVGPVGFILDRQQYLGRYQGGFSPESVAWDDVIVGTTAAPRSPSRRSPRRRPSRGQRSDGQFRVTHVFVSRATAGRSRTCSTA